MSFTFDGVDDNITTSSAPVTSQPLTISGWYWNLGSASPGTQVIASICTNAGVPRWSSFIFNAATGDDNIQAQSVNSGGNNESLINPYTIPAGWNHICGVFTSDTSRQCFANGTSATLNTTSRSVSGVNRLVIGARWNTTLGGYFNGRLAEIAVWNAALNTDEVNSLRRGITAAKIRPESLAFYAPMLRDAKDIVGGADLTITGATASPEHPRIYR